MNAFRNENKVGSQYQNFAHLLYRQGVRGDNQNPDSAIAVSSYKAQNPGGQFGAPGNTKTVPVTSFPNGRVGTMLQNSYSNSGPQNTESANYTRPRINNSISRSKSVYKDQDWARNGSCGSRSTASHSSGLPPAFKKNSSISADYGKNYQHVNQGQRLGQKIINSSKIRMSSNSSGRSGINNNIQAPGINTVDNKIQPVMKTSGKPAGTWTLKGSNVQNDYVKTSGRFIFTRLHLTSDIDSNQISNRPPSKRLNSLNRPESSNRSSLNKLPACGGEEYTTVGGEHTVIHVIDENKKKQKDFKCSLSLLLKHMKYFEKYLKSTEPTEDIDISVHCDVFIFEWLLNYIENDEKEQTGNHNIKFYDVVSKEGDSYKIMPTNKRKKPVFEIGNTISILISSDYLKMNKLVDE